MRQISLFICLQFVLFAGFSQQQHLEIGAKLGFKDEFHLRPSFDLNSSYTEIHYFDVYFFGRVSKRRNGSEFGIGFEKPTDYFVRYTDKSTQFGYVNLNRVQLDLSEYFYLVKTPIHKWDLQIGLRNYFGFNKQIWIPHEMEMKTWKASLRIGTNYTFKNVIIGIFTEIDLRPDYVEYDRPIVFGLSSGVIF